MNARSVLAGLLVCLSGWVIVPGWAEAADLDHRAAKEQGPADGTAPRLDPIGPEEPGSLSGHGAEGTGDSAKLYRAILERAAVLGVGTIWYWSNVDFNRVDWQLGWDAESWKRKLLTFDAIRFDSNYFDTNAYSHALGGAAYHLISRSNNLSLPGSMGFNFLASGVWEYLIEYREYVSLNDMILTPIAGAAIGESLFQLGAFFGRSGDITAYRVLSILFSPLQAFHDWIDDRSARYDLERDAYGLSLNVWHRFSLSAGFSHSIQDGSEHSSSLELGLTGELVGLPGYSRPGNSSGFNSDLNLTRFIVRTSIGSEGLDRLMAGFRIAPFGYYFKDVEGDPAGAMRGQAVLLALGPAYEYSRFNTSGFGDKFAIVHMPGLSLEWSGWSGALRARAQLNVFFDFALVESLANGRYADGVGQLGVKTVLSEQGYYYAYGASVSPQLVLAAEQLEVGSLLKYHRFYSIDKFDRFQEEIVEEVHLEDSHLLVRVWMAFSPGPMLPTIEAYLIRRMRTGQAESFRVAPFRADFEETVFGVELQYRI
jgi:hypothetical protein